MRSFDDIKREYVQAREKERKDIIEYLEKAGFTVMNKRGGKGKTNYTSNHTLQLPYDLSNWKWIETKKDGVFYFISFQAFDQDTSSGNYHVLMDRLGIYRYVTYNAKEAFETMTVTDIDLPMDEDKYERLLEYLQ